MKNVFFLACLAAITLVVSGCVQPPGQQPGSSQYGNFTPDGQNASNMPPRINDSNPPPGQHGPNDPNVQPEGNGPAMDPNAPLPTLPSNVPKGEWTTKKVGDVEVRYFSTAIARGMTESGTDFFIYMRNTGSAKATMCFTTITGEFRSAFIPGWNLHFFAMQDPPIDIEPGQEKRLWYFASLDGEPGKSDSFFPVNFSVGYCGQESQSIAVPVTFGVTGERFGGKETSYVYGTVTDEDGAPVAGANVAAMANCGRLDHKEMTKADGSYNLRVLAKEDVDAIYLNKSLACDSTDYYVNVDQPGYEYYYNGHVAPSRAEPQKLDIVLKKDTGALPYKLDWEKQVKDNFGFYWVKPSSDWSVFAVAQSKHPPELNKPTNFYLFDANGNILWKQPTANECWGIAIAGDGSEVVAGCHDAKVYAVNRAGTLLWTANLNGMSRSACISNDGKKVLSGDAPILYDAATGAITDLHWRGDWLRNCAFYRDNSGFVAGAREVTGFDMQGNQKWRYVIGEFPLFMGVDSGKDTFAAGKSRTIFSFDASGNLRWKHKIPDHVVTAGAVTPDGSRIAVGTVGSMVYLFDNNGNLLWKRGTRAAGLARAVGHNAIAISEDGSVVVAGTTGQSGESGPVCVVEYNEKGTIIWENCVNPDTSNPDLLLGVTNVQISKDKKQIIATYGDNYIRKFSLDAG
jgi:WD40 repeat protein